MPKTRQGKTGATRGYREAWSDPAGDDDDDIDTVDAATGGHHHHQQQQQQQQQQQHHHHQAVGYSDTCPEETAKKVM